MKRECRLIRSWSLAVLVSAALAACSDRPAGDQSTGDQSTGSPSAAAKPGKQDTGCPLSVSDVSESVGTPVRLSLNLASPGGNYSACQFEIEERPGVFVELTVRPAAAADSLFESIKTSAKGMLGQSAEADRIDVGEGGWAYGSGSRSEAAAVARGRLYHANMEYFGETTVGDRKDAMVRLLEKMVR